MAHKGDRVRFLAPELSAGITERFRTTQASDIFALSMTFLNTWTQQPPFFEIPNEAKVAASIRQGLRPKRPALKVNLPRGEDEFWSLSVFMWEQEPSNRPSSEAVRDGVERMFSPFSSASSNNPGSQST